MLSISSKQYAADVIQRDKILKQIYKDFQKKPLTSVKRTETRVLVSLLFVAFDILSNHLLIECILSNSMDVVKRIRVLIWNPLFFLSFFLLTTPSNLSMWSFFHNQRGITLLLINFSRDTRTSVQLSTILGIFAEEIDTVLKFSNAKELRNLIARSRLKYHLIAKDENAEWML